MSAIPLTPHVSDHQHPWHLPYRGRIGMYCLILGESAIFIIFVLAYVFYIGKSLTGPTPQQVLEVPIFNSICLLSSSVTIWLAERNLEHRKMKPFALWWALTIVLGLIFLVGTGMEWHTLIYEKGLTVSTNLFGTTFYSLVGLHASHVIFGLIGLSLVLIFTLTGHVKEEHAERIQVLALYWHFVDAIWIVVFTVVYIIGR
ncbi:cytochrome c oxidase subunit 3/cytochrome o ubiquinol oxidase subunit 3 [Silvibacterium bohemicum]|jgi:cytochrome c oxidase subunit 3/cytochrome o ubiquinol oxidase subunit 3|uniref:Cytochrome c oxidase subunit 3/cytochrome o ubiquinol oxidase subunit 3 n=1 Tax=Silvibacterium bohemicum TaxID=1577686 RepID=A0A841JYT8_9BACT|nr:heme-copper oxidase subunit III [Silvibacterium bohemicum]MBB6146310.1 cytochrome c oxidase subunit 3/cytochrome o ubiquinol oxidase subunit 3 [Silvibacterium bohemicum]